ncbi:MAG: DUF1176 domain-containing protein [Mesorhizobium sp.]|nr:DUF1176 domain-containing protein [Mesorhizobium sp.]MBL8576101.1 DUF1176 domain-containing protein [Mesorhizobium sp.]
MRVTVLAFPTAVLLSCIPTLAAHAQETRYIDDRSSAASLIQSYYNAINRQEYARAWGYFGDQKPAKDLDTFAKGYEGTQQVNVITGNVASEGAAGSTFYYLPVSITAFDKGGGEKVFAGCYTLRLANPAIQGEPFIPLHIDKGNLKQSTISYEEALPTDCPDAPAPEQSDTVLSDARTLFNTAHTECDRNLPGGDPANVEVEQYRIPYRYSTDADSEPERTARLFRFYCSTGAYNESHVYYQHDENEGLREVQFATPELDIRYENDDSDEKVKSLSIIGYTATSKLVNSFYDEASRSITSAGKWRGVGDASDSGTWLFRNGEFTLVKYDVDASYDGEINPETVLDYDMGP